MRRISYGLTWNRSHKCQGLAVLQNLAASNINSVITQILGQRVTVVKKLRVPTNKNMTKMRCCFKKFPRLTMINSLFCQHAACSATNPFWRKKITCQKQWVLNMSRTSTNTRVHEFLWFWNVLFHFTVSHHNIFSVPTLPLHWRTFCSSLRSFPYHTMAPLLLTTQFCL